MQNERKRLRVLFLCTGNSCRSQMAEGWAGSLKGDALETFSAGTEPRDLDPLAVRAMREVGIDISKQRSKHLDELKDMKFDYIVTVCDRAAEACPVFPGETKMVHRGFANPPALADGARTEEEALIHYRRVRDEIRDFVKTLPESLYAS